MRRSDGTRSYDLGVYSRLAYANDWGDPLSFRASLNTFILGTDLGFYYNAWGAELKSVTENGSRLTWRALRRAAEQRAGDDELLDPEHDQREGVHVQRRHADDEHRRGVGAAPRRGRASTRTAGASRTTSAPRARSAGAPTHASRTGASPSTARVSHGLGKYLDWQIGAGAGHVGRRAARRSGTTSSAAPGRSAASRRASCAGDAYWLGHFELGSSFVAVRPTLFFDIGWAGSRNDWQHIGDPGERRGGRRLVHGRALPHGHRQGGAAQRGGWTLGLLDGRPASRAADWAARRSGG